MYRGQNLEDKTISEYFGQFAGTLLSIGENNGTNLSNVRYFLNREWVGDLVEPSPQVFIDLEKMYSQDEFIYCHQLAIGDRNGPIDLYDSGELLGVGDRALVSTVKKEETERWASLKMPFNQVEVEMVTFKAFMEDYAMFKTYDLISVDAEGMDIIILRQMELDQLGCRCLVIEHNSLPANVAIILEYTKAFGFKEIGYNAENIILAR